MQNFDGSFILSHKHKIILQKFTESFLNEIRTLSENIKIFEQEMVRSGNDRILMQKKSDATRLSQKGHSGIEAPKVGPSNWWRAV
jgi:hypothetical protein